MVSDIMAKHNIEALTLDIHFNNHESYQTFAEAYNLSLITLSIIENNDIMANVIEKIMRKHSKNIKRLEHLIGDYFDPFHNI